MKKMFWAVCFCGGLTLAAQAQPMRNLASLQEGGRLVHFSSQYNDSDWKAENLIDGSAGKGWAGRGSGAQSVVIGFKDHRLALVEDILIDPYSREAPTNWIKEVEVQVSTTYPFRDYRTVGRMTLANQGGDQVLSLSQPTQARYVKIRFLSNHGGGYMEAGEVGVMGRLLPESGPAPEFSNLAAASSGATIEKFTSQYNETDWAAANLLGDDGTREWSGKSSSSQEIVISLPEAAEVSDISIDNYSGESMRNCANNVEVSISPESSYKGFEVVGRLELPPIGDLHTVTLDPPRLAKYVKVSFRDNHGGGYLQAARIRVYRTQGRPGSAIARQLSETGRAVVREIHFEFNSAGILPESESVLRGPAAPLTQDPSLELIIEGHTDSVGGAEFNLELSRRRAESVKRWLVDRAGVAETRLTTVGYGLTRPVADNDSEEGKAQNRRVELVRKSASAGR